MKHIKQAIVALAITLITWTPAMAEAWLSLEDYVSRCELIVKAKTVSQGADRPLSFQVLESWKGQYHPDLLENTLPDGRFTEQQGRHGIHVVDGQEIVFFFTRNNNPRQGPLTSHSTAFPVTDGMVVYGSTSLGMRKEYTVEDFKKTILALVKMQN